MTQTGAPGRFITFEGGEGAGKSTQIRRLSAELTARGIAHVLTREPGGSPRAERIRELILSGGAKPFGPTAEAALFFAARDDHLETTIRPALARGQWVLCDRFSDSTRAYQGTSGAVNPRFIAAMERLIVGETRPDLTLVLDLPPQEGLRRAQGRGGKADRFESEGLAFHERLRQAFLAIAAEEPERCAVIDAARPPDLVAADILAEVSRRLGFARA